MKKIAILLVSTLALGACTEEFITKEPLGVGSNVSFYDTPENCELAVNAIYDPLQWEEMYSRNYWAIGDVASDDAEKGGGNSVLQYSGDQLEMHDLNTFNVNQLNGYIIDMWQSYYIGIARANGMLDETGDFVNGKDSTIYKRMRGEARFLRAYYYFDMVKIWGPVPLVEHVVKPGDAKNIGNRAEGDDEKGSKQIRLIYDFIISELEAVKNDVPWTYDEANDGRVTAGAVRALLAKAYLFRADVCNVDADYELAFQTAKGLIDNPNNPYELEEHYQDAFDMNLTNENSKEFVFKINFMDAPDGSAYNRDGKAEGSVRSTYVGPRYYVKDDGSIAESGAFGYGFDMPTQNLVDAFNSADPRLTMMYMPDDSIYFDAPSKGNPKWYKISYPSYSTGYYCKKMGLNYDKFAASQPQTSGKDYAVIRYADVLLIAAEAGVKSTHSGDALNYINQIRTRARNSARTMTAYDTYTYTPGTVPANLSSVTIEDVRLERRLELYCEGHRYFDVVRWGQAEEIFGALKFDVAGNPINYKPATLGRFPIPQEQIILHSGGNLIQNPGY